MPNSSPECRAWNLLVSARGSIANSLYCMSRVLRPDEDLQERITNN